MKVLITGSGGFVGRHLVKHLNCHDHHVIPCDIECGIDIFNQNALSELPSVDAIVHLAAKTYIPDAFSSPRDTYYTNVIGTLNLLEIARIRKIEKFIYISSYMYGQPQQLPIKETHPIDTINPYNRSKKLGEDLCSGYVDDFGLNIDIIRPFNLYGAGQDSRFIIPSLISQYFSESTEITVNTLSPKRDYLYIQDFIELLYCTLMKNSTGLKIYNAGAGKSYSVKDIIDNLAIIIGKSKNIIETGVVRKGEIADTVADINLAKIVLNWAPKYSLVSGLTETIHLEKQNNV